MDGKFPIRPLDLGSLPPKSSDSEGSLSPTTPMSPSSSFSKFVIKTVESGGNITGLSRRKVSSWYNFKTQLSNLFYQTKLKSFCSKTSELICSKNDLSNEQFFSGIEYSLDLPDEQKKLRKLENCLLKNLALCREQKVSILQTARQPTTTKPVTIKPTITKSAAAKPADSAVAQPLDASISEDELQSLLTLVQGVLSCTIGDFSFRELTQELTSLLTDVDKVERDLKALIQKMKELRMYWLKLLGGEPPSSIDKPAKFDPQLLLSENVQAKKEMISIVKKGLKHCHTLNQITVWSAMPSEELRKEFLRLLSKEGLLLPLISWLKKISDSTVDCHLVPEATQLLAFTILGYPLESWILGEDKLTLLTSVQNVELYLGLMSLTSLKFALERYHQSCGLWLVDLDTGR